MGIRQGKPQDGRPCVVVKATWGGRPLCSARLCPPRVCCRVCSVLLLLLMLKLKLNSAEAGSSSVKTSSFVEVRLASIHAQFCCAILSYPAVFHGALI